MFSTLRVGEIERQCLDPLSRQEALEALRFRRECLPPDLQEGLEMQPTDRLLLLLLVARLLGALRH